MNNEILRIGPPPGKARAAVILLHGRGSSGHDITRLAEAVPDPGVSWLAPSAASGSWYPQRFLVPPSQNEPSLSESLQTINRLFGQLQEAGLPSERIAFAGFSQGACLAIEYAFRNPRRYGFVAALSGALIGPIETARDPVDLQQSPVLLGCAEHDAHIPEHFVDHSEHLLRAANASLTRLRFPGSTHSVFPEELDWMKQAIAALPAR